MVDFKKVDEYIELIEQGEIPEGFTFNEFAIEFFNQSKVIPLSKYLRSKGKTSKIPKIMNTKKAGELLVDTQKSENEVKMFLRRKGFADIPELNYTVVMLLRKVDLLDNWRKIATYLSSDKTIEEINNSTKCQLLPNEIEKLENYIMNELNIKEQELNTILSQLKKVFENKELLKSVKKLIKQ